jgi:AraC-like DNA-binding protein
LTGEQAEAERAFIEAGEENLPAIINDILVFGQFFVYYTAIFFDVRTRKKHLQDNFSDRDYMEIRWTQRFLTVFCASFFIALAVYVFNPRTDVWLIPILNVFAMGYLVYVVVFHSTALYLSRLSDVPAEMSKSADRNEAAAPAMSESQMKDICDRITEYLQTSKAYTNPEFSLSMLSVQTGISLKNISRSINGYLHRNFFDVINKMRFEEAKRLLMELDAGYTTDSIYPECGFQSRSSFYTTFNPHCRLTAVNCL